MAVSAKVGAFTLLAADPASTDYDLVLGFTPKALIVWWMGHGSSTDACAAGSITAGMGFAVSDASERCAVYQSTNGAASGTSGRGNASGSLIRTITAAGSVDGSAHVTVWGSTITIRMTDVVPVDVRVHYLALGGDSITDAEIGGFDANDATGSQTVNTGFQGDCVLFSTTFVGSDTVGSASGAIAFGGATAAGQWCASICNEQGSANADTATYVNDAECIGWVNPTNVAQANMRATFTSFDATPSFTINWAEIGFTGARIVNYLLLKGASVAIGNLLTQTDTTTPINVTGQSFQPAAVMFISGARAEDTIDTPSSHAHLSIGAATSATERGAQAAWEEDGVANMQNARAVEHDEVYINISASDTVQGLMDLTAMNSDGFSCLMDDADPAQNFVVWMAFGPATATSIDLQGSASGAATATGALTTSIALAGAVDAQATVSGALTTAIPLAGSVSGAATVTGELTTAIRMAGSLSGVATAAAALTTAIPLDAAVSATGTATADLTTQIPLSASVTGVATASGSLAESGAALQASASAVASASADLSTAIALAGSVTGAGIATGDLTTAVRFAASVLASAAATAILSTQIALAGDALGAADCSGVLTDAVVVAFESTTVIASFGPSAEVSASYSTTSEPAASFGTSTTVIATAKG
jgi:hypothetical protein